MTTAIAGLGKAANARDEYKAATAAIDVAQAAVDIELRYRPPDEIDLARFELWARQTVVDTAAKRLGASAATSLLALREAEVDKDLAAVREAAARVSATAASLELLR
jgi:hypothetical protein